MNSTDTQTNTANTAQPESRQVRRANMRRMEKRVRQHQNEVVLKKNQKRSGHYSG